MAAANTRTTSVAYSLDYNDEIIFSPLGQNSTGLALNYFEGAAATTCHSVPHTNSIEGSINSTFLVLETAPPLREPSARSVRRFRRQAAAEVAAGAAAVASVATAALEPVVAVATAVFPYSCRFYFSLAPFPSLICGSDSSGTC